MSDKIENTCERRQLALPLELNQAPPLWRPIHYLGSKLRVVDAIRENLLDLDPTLGTVCDLFAGSGTVSMALSSERNVVAADIQEYSRVICAAILQPVAFEESRVERLFKAVDRNRRRLEPCLEPILEFEDRAIQYAFTDPSLLCDLVEHGSLLTADARKDLLGRALSETVSRIDKEQERELMTTRYFGGRYFSYRQALCIDCILAAIDELPSGLKGMCLAAVLSTASGIVNSIGKQFAQSMRLRRNDGTIKAHLITQTCRDRQQEAREVFREWLSRYRELRNSSCHRVVRGDYRDVLHQLDDVAVIYADPPYTRDHYSRFYHVLETLSLRDFPSISTTLLTGEGATSRGIYRTDRHQSPFCIKSEAPGAFAELFAGSANLGVPLLVSYSPFITEGHPRLMTVDAVTKLALEYYRRVEVVPAGRMTHSKLNKTELHLGTAYDAEVLIRCR